MENKTSKLLGLTAVFSIFFVAVCLSVHFVVPAAQMEEDIPVSLFAELSSEDNFENEKFDFLAEYASKTDLYGDLTSKTDQGLTLYREPQSRSSVEWFYTHITNSRDVSVAILENAEKNNVPLSLAFALAYVESNYRPNAVNKNSNFTVDRGLFQLNSASFPKLSEEDFFDPSISAKYGMTHFRHCLNVAGNEITALAMYNAGTYRVKNNKTPQSTLNYVAKIEKYRKMIDGMFENEVLAFYQVGTKNRALAKK